MGIGLVSSSFTLVRKRFTLIRWQFNLPPIRPTLTLARHQSTLIRWLFTSGIITKIYLKREVPCRCHISILCWKVETYRGNVSDALIMLSDTFSLSGCRAQGGRGLDDAIFKDDSIEHAMEGLKEVSKRIWTKQLFSLCFPMVTACAHLHDVRRRR